MDFLGLVRAKCVGWFVGVKTFLEGHQTFSRDCRSCLDFGVVLAQFVDGEIGQLSEAFCNVVSANHLKIGGTVVCSEDD